MLLALFPVVLFSTTPFAQNFPGKPVKLIVPYATGGPLDLLARPVAQRLSESLGQPFVVDFKPGAAGAIGADFVSKSPPDGYTLLVISSGHTIIASTQRLPYDTLRDLAAVSPVSQSDIVLVANPKLPIGNLRELIALVKSQPGKLNYGSSGAGGSLHLAMERFKLLAGVDIVHIPYKGAGPALIDVVAGATDLMFISAPTVIPQINAGKVRLLGVASLKRAASLPNAPTFIESGMPNFDAASIIGILAPAATPRPVINRLNGALEKILAAQDLKELFERNGVEPWSSTPEQFATWLRDEVVKWGEVARAIKYQPE